MTRTRVPSSSVTSGMSRADDVLVARRGHLERRRAGWPRAGSRASAPARRPAASPGGGCRCRPSSTARRRRRACRGCRGCRRAHGAGEHVGDRLDAAVRMPREAGEVVVRVVVAEVVEQQERIELARCRRTRRRGAASRPAPSMVGVAWMMRLTGRMDMAAPRGDPGRTLSRGSGFRLRRSAGGAQFGRCARYLPRFSHPRRRSSGCTPPSALLRGLDAWWTKRSAGRPGRSRRTTTWDARGTSGARG